jgi:hypothetical protein
VEGLEMIKTRMLARLVIPVLVATAFQTLVAGEPTAKPTSNSAAKPAVRAGVSTSAITISITSTMRHGKLVVLLDDVPVFKEEFQKPALVISQTTTWDPLQVTAGKHRLSAKVFGMKKTYLSAIYDLNVSRTKGSELRFLMKGDKLTVEVAS